MSQPKFEVRFCSEHYQPRACCAPLHFEPGAAIPVEHHDDFRYIPPVVSLDALDVLAVAHGLKDEMDLGDFWMIHVEEGRDG